MLVKNHLFKGRVPLMSAALDAYALRQKTIAKNIANINTPHYNPKRVSFEEQFQNLSNTETVSGSLNTLPDGTYPVKAMVEDVQVHDDEKYVAGESHVNIDKEMGELALNQIRTRFATQMVSRYFKGLGSAITGQASAN